MTLRFRNEIIEDGSGEPADLKASPFGSLHMLVTGLDYSCDTQSWAGPPPNGTGPLDTKVSWILMQHLGDVCGASTIKTLWNKECTKKGFEAALKEMSQVCQPKDTFVFYYTGHGENLPCTRVGSKNEFDQCFCLVDEFGNTDDKAMQYRNVVWLRDNDFAKWLTEFFSPDVQIFVIVDACHSGSICDFDEEQGWQKGFKALSLCGSADKETSAGTGKGGRYTRSLTRALQHYWENQPPGKLVDVGSIYNTLQEFYKKYKQKAGDGHTQNFTVNSVGGHPKDFIWPFVPQRKYVSPANCGLIRIEGARQQNQLLPDEDIPWMFKFADEMGFTFGKKFWENYPAATKYRANPYLQNPNLDPLPKARTPEAQRLLQSLMPGKATGQAPAVKAPPQHAVRGQIRRSTAPAVMAPQPQAYALPMRGQMAQACATPAMRAPQIYAVHGQVAQACPKPAMVAPQMYRAPQMYQAPQRYGAPVMVYGYQPPAGVMHPKAMTPPVVARGQ